MQECFTCTGRLVTNAILWGATFESESVTIFAGFFLPQTTKVERHHIQMPVRQCGYLFHVTKFRYLFIQLIQWPTYFAGFVPRNETQIVSSCRIATPFVVSRHHQQTVFVVTTLLPSSVTSKIEKINENFFIRFKNDSITRLNRIGST